MLIFNAQEDHSGQPVFVDLYLTRITAFSLKRIEQISTVLFVPHARQHGGLQFQSSQAKGNIR